MSFASNCIFFLAVSAIAGGTQALGAPAPEFGPNPAVSWVVISNGYLPPESGPGPIRQDPAHPYVGNDEFRRTGRQPTMPFADLSSTILQPWTREVLKKRNELVLAGKAPTLGIDCGPAGGAAFLIRSNVQPYFFVQAPNKVLIILQDDHQFRHIYLRAAHSPNLKPSWTGESIGHYEGDELVVDTIGIAATAPIDRFFTPHTDQLHLIERFRLTSAGGPTLNENSSSGGPNLTFPATESVVRISSSGLSADATATTGGATISVLGVGSSYPSMNLTIPAVGITAYVQLGSLASPTSGSSTGVYSASMAVASLSYTSFGIWAAANSDGTSPFAVGAFALGFETPAAAIPASGTANYSGTGNVIGNVYVAGKIGGTPAIVNGDASLMANFGTGQINGALTNMVVHDHANPSQPANVYAFPWNDVSVSASIAAGTAKFSGSTAAASQPVSPYALKSTATGSINGGFYGPNAENIGAVWTLSNGDGTGSALGVIGATKQ